LILLGTFRSWAQGGPPMLTDDPGTPGNGKWEINIADVTQFTSQTVSQFPYSDINYGWGDHVQLKYESALNSVSSQTMPVGGSQAIVGVKWRFFDEESDGVDVSMYPQYQFTPSYIANNPANGQSSFFLPIELSKKFGEITLNPEVGYSFQYGGGYGFWVVGVLADHEFDKKFEIMVEVFADIGTAANETETLFNLGGRYNWNEVLTFLFSAGLSLQTPPDIPTMQFSYLGLQLHL